MFALAACCLLTAAIASASFVKFSLLLLLKVFSKICASRLNSKNSVSLSSNWSSKTCASSKACFLSAALNSSSCLDLSLKFAISLSNLDLSTISFRSILSALAPGSYTHLRAHET